MDFHFPDELLTSSVLIPIGASSASSSQSTTKVISKESHPDPTPTTPPSSTSLGKLIPEKRKGDSITPVPPVISASASLEGPDIEVSIGELSPRADFGRYPSRTPSLGSMNSAVPNNILPSNAFRTLQLQLEKEKELYLMHVQGASQCSERITALLNEINCLLEQGVTSSPQASQFPRQSINNSQSSLNSRLSSSQTAPKIPKPSYLDATVTVRAKFFPRKPRCLSFVNSNSFISSSLDGSVQLCSLTGGQVTMSKSIYLPSLLQKPCAAEDLCVATTLGGALVSTIDAVVGSEADPGNSPSSLIFIPFEKGQGKTKVLHNGFNSPHSKAISVIKQFEGSALKSADAKFAFMTGGLDKNVALWTASSIDAPLSVKEVHHSHTSAVQALAQLPSDLDVIWSGGADCRLVAWSLKGQQSKLTHRFPHRISHLLSNGHHPHSLLSVFSATNQQIRLMDTRMSIEQPAFTFGQAEQNSTSRYLRPSWCPSSGNLIALGTSSPENLKSAIHIWDIRQLTDSHNSRPVKSIDAGTERRFLACEFSPDGAYLLAHATDSSLSIVDFY